MRWKSVSHKTYKQRFTLIIIIWNPDFYQGSNQPFLTSGELRNSLNYLSLVHCQFFFLCSKE